MCWPERLFDTTAEYHARWSGEKPGKWDFAEAETLWFSPLPCWEHLPAKEIHAKFSELVKEIEQETRDRFEAEGRSPMGVKRILQQQPHAQAARTKKSPAPLVHAATLEAWIRYRETWPDFQARYRSAADRFRRGDLQAVFPEGCFRPFGAFVPVANQVRPRPG